MNNHAENPFAGKHILVVDDMPAFSELLASILELEGYVVSTAISGEQALAFAAQQMPDLIMLDIIMEGIDGFETCARLKADEVVKHIPIVFVTSKTDAEDVVKGFNLGAVDFVIKPFRKEDVCARVATHLKVQALFQAQKEQLIQAEKLASIAELMGEFSHELGTPIGIILTAQTHLEEKIKEFTRLLSNNQLTKSKLTAFVDQVEDINRLTLSNVNRAIERTNSFKRLSVDQCSEERRVFNLLEYLNYVKQALHTKFINTEHRLDIDCDEHLTIDSFPGALSQVIINLINNSLLHGFEHREQGHILIRVSRQGQGVKLLFEDDGQGIDGELLPKIFNQYFTSKPGSGGSGIGLYLVKNIIEKKLCGKLSCQSEPGKGTSFEILLPPTPDCREKPSADA